MSTVRELPELPAPEHTYFRYQTQEDVRSGGYTAEQMHTYGRECARLAAGEWKAPEADLVALALQVGAFQNDGSHGIPRGLLVTFEADQLADFARAILAPHKTSPAADAGWMDIASAPKDGSPVIVADIHEGHVFEVVNGFFEVLAEDEEDGPWSLDGGKPTCSYVGRAAGTYFSSWLHAKELDTRWRVTDSFPYTHWMPLPPPPASIAKEET